MYELKKDRSDSVMISKYIPGTECQSIVYTILDTSDEQRHLIRATHLDTL